MLIVCLLREKDKLVLEQKKASTTLSGPPQCELPALLRLTLFFMSVSLFSISFAKFRAQFPVSHLFPLHIAAAHIFFRFFNHFAHILRRDNDDTLFVCENNVPRPHGNASAMIGT
jgi:hypothetical protein